MSDLKQLTPEDVISVFRTDGILSGMVIFMKKNPVVTVAKKYGVDSLEVCKVFEQMRLDGLLLFKAGRQVDAEFAFAEWQKRNSTAQPKTTGNEIPSAEEVASIPVQPNPDDSEFDCEKNPKSDTEDTGFFASLPKTNPPIIELVKRIKELGNPQVHTLTLKHFATSIRTMFGVTRGQIKHLVDVMLALGLTFPMDEKLKRVVFSPNIWNHRATRCSDPHRCKWALLPDKNGKPVITDTNKLIRKARKQAIMGTLAATIKSLANDAQDVEPVEVETEPLKETMPTEPEIQPAGPVFETETEPCEPVTHAANIQAESSPEPQSEIGEFMPDNTLQFQSQSGDPVAEALRSLHAYLEVEENDAPPGSGCEDLTTRRITVKFKGSELLQPLLDGDADQALHAFESLRDDVFDEFRRLHRVINSLRSQQSSPSDELGILEIAIEEHVIRRLAELKSTVKKFMLEFRQPIKTMHELFQATHRYTDSLVQVAEQMDALEIDIVTQHPDSATKLKQHEKLLAEGRAMCALIKTSHEESERLISAIADKQAAFLELVSRADSIKKRLASFRDVIALMEAVLSDETSEELERAEHYLHLKPQQQEVFGVETKLRVHAFNQLEKKLDVAEMWRKDHLAHHVQTVVCTREQSGQGWHHPDCPKRVEDLSALVLIAIAVLIPGANGRREGRDLTFFATKILPRSGLIKDSESAAARKAANTIKQYLLHKKERSTYRYSVTDEGRIKAFELLSAMPDPADIQKQIESAYIQVGEDNWKKRKASSA